MSAHDQDEFINGKDRSLADFLDSLNGDDQPMVTLIPVAELSSALRAEVAALESLGASAGEFKIESAVIVNDPMAEAGTGLSPDPSSRFSGDANAPAFYSALSRAIETSMPRDKAGMTSPEQARAWINSKAREGRLFKAAEVQWSGITDFLDGASAKFFVVDLIAILAAEGVQLVEIINGGPNAQQQRSAQQERVDEIVGRLFGALGAEGGTVTINGVRRFEDDIFYMLLDREILPEQLPESMRKAAAEFFVEYPILDNFAPIDFNVARYDKYTVPNGTNYRELLLTAPNLEARRDSERERYENWCRSNNHFPSSTAAEERYERLTGQKAPPPITMTERSRREARQFRSSHFQARNIVAHIRFDERVGPNSERVLFIDELQSDWGQQGKKHGFKSADAHNLPTGYTVVIHDSTTSPITWETIDHNGQNVSGGTFFANNQEHALVVARDAHFAKLPQVPVGPFVMKTDNWVALAVKRMVRYAAENGFDQVAFISGKQAAALYDLRKEVDDIAVEKTETGFNLSGWRHASPSGQLARSMIFKKDVSDVKEMSDVIGKELAERAEKLLLVAGEVEIFSGNALAVGGDGMLYFYDSLVPQVVDDVLKKLGGGKVGPLNIDITDYGFSGRTAEKSQYAAYREQVGFAITPEMRALVMHGLPMFRGADAIAPTPVLATRQGDIDPAGAYFATYGSSTYFDAANTGISKYDISAVSLIDTNVAEQAIALLEEALRDDRLTSEDRDLITQEITSVHEYGGGVGYMFADSMPLSDAGKRLGFDGMKVVENDDWVSGSSVFIWNTETVKPMAEADFQTEFERQFGDSTPLDGDAFDAWFGQSKVTTPDMKPMVLYHGTGDDTGGVFKPNSFFTARPDVAAIYASAPTRQVADKGPNISAVFMRLENPYYFDAQKINNNLSHHVLGKRGNIDQVAEHLKAQGYDGIILQNYPDLGGPQDQYVAFSSGQIKSATGNNGDFDPNNDDIRFRVEGQSQVEISDQFSAWSKSLPIITDFENGAGARGVYVTYHATALDFTEFKVGGNNPSTSGHAIWLSPYADLQAAAHNIGSRTRPVEGTRVMKLYTRLERPLVLDDADMIKWARDVFAGGSAEFPQLMRKEWADEISEEYDGIIWNPPKYKEDSKDAEIIVFDPTQIKSAFSNMGEFSQTNGDIRFKKEKTEITNAFAGWFGESKVVNGDGKPSVVYHGTQADELTAFIDRDQRQGFYFADRPEYANSFAEGVGANVIPVFLAITNPANLRKGISEAMRQELKSHGYEADTTGYLPDELWNLFDGDASLSNALKAAGYDGVRMVEPHIVNGEAFDSWMAFYSHQIKSAISNNGNFDPVNNDIRFKRGDSSTPTFKAWFGDSQAVTANGDPLVVFHGTGSPEFTSFEKSLLGTSTGGADAKQGFFFAQNPSSAEQFIWKSGEKSGAIYPVYLALQNPKVIDDFVLTGANGTAAGRLIASAKAAGHDGVIFSDSDMLGHLGRSFVVFEPEQIKSAIGNDGSFDPANPDIRFRRNGKTLSWSQKRLDALLSAYSYPTNPKRTRAYAAMISPEDFLNLTATANTLERIQSETGLLDLAALEAETQDMYLRVDGITETMPRVDGHEGRHRAYALQQAGYTQIPVVLYFGEGSAVEPADSKLLLPQLFHSDRVALASGRIYDLVPIATKYEAMLRERFVEAGSVRFRTEAESLPSIADNIADATPAAQRSDGFKSWFAGSKIVSAQGNPLIVYHGTTSDITTFESVASRRIYLLDGVEIKRTDSWEMGADGMGCPAGYHYAAVSNAQALQISDDPRQGAAAALRMQGAEAHKNGSESPDTKRIIADLKRMVGKKLESKNVVRPTGDGFYFTPDLAYSYVRDAGNVHGGNVMPLYLSIKNPIYLDASKIESAGASINLDTYKAQGHDGAIFADHPADLTRRGYGGSVQIVAFDPAQIKSAIGNNSDFNPQNKDVRFRRLPDTRPDMKVSASAELNAVQALAKAFNSRLGLLKLTKDSTFKFSGVHLNSTIWLNQASEKPFHAVFGHELTHQMQHERPDLYASLVSAVEPLLVNRDGYRAMMGLEGMSADHLRDEMVADLVGDRFAEKSFWEMVAVRSGPVFSGIAAFVSAKIDIAKAALTGTPRNRTLGSNRFVNDLDLARGHIATTVAAYASWKVENQDHGKSSRKAGFFESLTESVKKMVEPPLPEVPVEDRRWLASALAENIDARINAVYEKVTGKPAIFAAVFDWLNLYAFKPKHKENAESDLAQIASERGLIAPSRGPVENLAPRDRVERLLAAGAALNGKRSGDTDARPDSIAPL